MAEIYNAPKEIELPNYSFDNVGNWKDEEASYKKKLIAHINDMGYNGKNVGEIIRLPMADSYAQYMVLSMKPLGLIHLELGDAWTSEFAELLTAKKVNQMIEADKRIPSRG